MLRLRWTVLCVLLRALLSATFAAMTHSIAVHVLLCREKFCMSSKGISFCHTCGYAITGAFWRCIRCTRKGMQYYSRPNDPELIARLKKQSGFKESSSSWCSILTVTILICIASAAYTVATASSKSPPIDYFRDHGIE